MVFNHKKFLLFLICLFGFGFFLSHNTYASTLGSDYYSITSWMMQADGAPTIYNNNVNGWRSMPVTTSSESGVLVRPTQSVIQTRTLFGYVLGVSFTPETPERYNTAQAEFWFYAPSASFMEFHNVNIDVTYFRTDNSYDRASCTAQSTPADVGNDLFVLISCGTVSNSDYVAYNSAYLHVGNSDGNDVNSKFFYRFRNGGGFWFYKAIVDSATSDDPQLTAIENQTNVIIDGFNNIENSINNRYEKEDESIDNISDQSPSDIPNSSDSQTTSIISTISSFITALGNVSAGDCELTLPFPQFIGGDTVVNPCNGKDKAPSIISVASSLVLIGFFIPFAFVMLRMIFNEIRSFTNG